MRKKWLWYGLLGAGAFGLIALAFGAGVLFGRATPNNVQRPVIFRLPSLVTGHGALGTIQEVNERTLRVQSRDGTMDVVLIDRNTRIERNRQKIAVSDLKKGEHVVVIGAPDDQNQVKARWIRVLLPATLPAGWRKTPWPGESQ